MGDKDAPWSPDLVAQMLDMCDTFEEFEAMCDTRDLSVIFRGAARLASIQNEDWQGVPVPLPGARAVLVEGHPWQERIDAFNELMNPPSEENETYRIGDTLMCGQKYIRHWYSRARNAHVYVHLWPDGKIRARIVRSSPDRAMERLKLWLTTIGASDAWDLEAEHAARETLKAMLSDRQWRHYDLMGCFLEQSERSGLTYLFRRLRPTVVLSPHSRSGTMMCLCCLCLHPVGYYEDSWGGCMVPSDDVIAHLTMMRADEAHYWGKCNQHRPVKAEAGI